MKTIIAKYAGLLAAFFRASFMADIEYRFNIAARIATDIIWYAAQLSVFEVIFRHTSTLNGWTLDQMRVFMGALFVTDSLYMMLFSENLDHMGQKVRRGDLDLLLAKPVNTQVMLSFQKVSVAYFGNWLFSVGWLTWALLRVPDLQPWRVLWLVVTVPIGLSIGYSIRFVTASMALFFSRADAINYIWYQLYRLGTRPDSIYPYWLKTTILTVLPIAFLASVPAHVILGKTSPIVLLWGLGLSAVMIWGTTRVWRRGLRAYSSASS